MYKYIMLTIAGLIIISSPISAQELPSFYGPGFNPTIDIGYLNGSYPLPIWVISEPSFSNGSDICNGVGSSLNNGVSMVCTGSVTFEGQSPEDVPCLSEVPTGDTFVALCR